jgi:hypothetical protein
MVKKCNLPLLNSNTVFDYLTIKITKWGTLSPKADLKSRNAYYDDSNISNYLLSG